MSESLRNDGRIWVLKQKEINEKQMIFGGREILFRRYPALVTLFHGTWHREQQKKDVMRDTEWELPDRLYT